MMKSDSLISTFDMGTFEMGTFEIDTFELLSMPFTKKL